jgi:RsiW-degrading membrane proteinase PrsW (M82 family)
MGPNDIPALFYFFAAIFALSASVLWLRFGGARMRREREGGPMTLRWLTEAGISTGVALGLAAMGFLLSTL